MHAIRQKCRPKHQVLILKCYPRTTKGAVDVKPNSSELSYLLYYATTRRSKVQKVGAFLEKKTASDVWRARIGNVQVTLQILEALIEKAPRDLPLYSPYLLKILNLILRSGDITMVEASIPTFEAFCEHHDVASLSADQEYLKQYEEIVRIYASFGSTRPPPTKIARSAPVAMRWRVAGLQAVKSVASSEALASLAGRQLDVVVPILLENLRTDGDGYLEILLQRVQLEEKVDTEKILRRRTSIATVRTVETSGDLNPLALSGTTADADKLAEEDIGVLAIQCLKQIFVVNNRSQVRGATIATIKFIADRVAQNLVVTDTNLSTDKERGWATTIFMMISRWTPVQDRYVILVTAMETLIRSPLTEESLPQQLVLAHMTGSLLRSDINLIGLSVMDVLVGLIQHVVRILQLGGVEPHPQQRIPAGEASNSRNQSKQPSPSTSSTGAAIAETSTLPSTPRIELLARLQQCIGDLATHVYYADQISDMISAILLRLKPSPLSAIPNSAAAIEDPEAATSIVTASANLVEDPNTDGFFSFDTAKITALKAIKSILLVATKQSKMSGAVSLSRSRVGIRVWEGTQWLLRDGDGRVRKAYADALLTWLDREMTTSDLVVSEEKPVHSALKGLVRNSGDDSMTSLSKRAVSNASNREKVSKPSRTTFLQLFHLAIYENAHQYIDSEPDVALLHLLLVRLVDKLGVNAVKSGLPMIFRLQEDIQDAETMAKVRMGSLCHGYFWVLSEKFNFESSGVGREIQSEILRRKGKGFWVEIIRVPPVQLLDLGDLGEPSPEEGLPLDKIASESLTPFDDRDIMVELIAISYSESMTSPPNSPPTSPGRSFSHPILASTPAPTTVEYEIPEKIKEEMLSDWTREAVLAGALESSKTVSVNGSRAGTNVTGNHRNFLAVNGHQNGGTHSGTQSPGSHQHQPRSRPPSQAYGLVGGVGAVQKLRRESGPGGSPIPASDSSRNSVARVDHLKRVLSGQAPASQGLGGMHSDASSESMVSYDIAPSEISYDNRAATSTDIARRVSNDAPRSKSRDRVASVGEHLMPLSSNPTAAGTESTVFEEGEAPSDDDEVPPVPPLPTSLSLPGGFPRDTSQERLPPSTSAIQDYASADRPRSGRAASRGLRSRGGQSFQGSSWGDETNPVVDLETLLKGIETEGESIKRTRSGTVTVVKPPY